MLGEIWSYAEFARAAVLAAEAEARESAERRVAPATGRCTPCAAMLPTWFPRVNEIIRLIGSHNLLRHADRARRWPTRTCGR